MLSRLFDISKRLVEGAGLYRWFLSKDLSPVMRFGKSVVFGVWLAWELSPRSIRDLKKLIMVKEEKQNDTLLCIHVFSLRIDLRRNRTENWWLE